MFIATAAFSPHMNGASSGTLGVTMASSAQNASSACVAWRGFPATIAPLNAPIEIAGDDVGEYPLLFESFHGAALECAKRAAALKDQRGLFRDLFKSKRRISQASLYIAQVDPITDQPFGSTGLGSGPPTRKEAAKHIILEVEQGIGSLIQRASSIHSSASSGAPSMAKLRSPKSQ